jgi:N-acyl-D-amino-acid deacylase
MFMTDAWVEESGIQNIASFQCFPYFLIKAREAGIPLEKVINKMSLKTAEQFRLPLRGALIPGNYADVTVFDHNGLVVDPKTPDSTPEGIKYVIINGNVVIDDGVYKPNKCGKMVLAREDWKDLRK